MMDMQDNVDSGGPEPSDDYRYKSNAIKVTVILEKRGTFLFIKHTEYEITSEKHKSKAERRYNDFVLLNQLLVKKYAYRMVPRLPPKQLMLDSFLEERRRGLERWLRLMSQHPLLSEDEILKSFLVDQTMEYQQNMQEMFDRDPDEFFRVLPRQKLSSEQNVGISSNRDRMRVLLNQVMKLKRLIEQQAKRMAGQSEDFAEMSRVLSDIKFEPPDGSLDDFSKSYSKASEESQKVSGNQLAAVTERLDMLTDVLTAHSDMCDRVEKTLFRAADEKLPNDVDTWKRRKTFGQHCVNDETKFANKYLKLLPSILLQFSNEEAKVQTKISDIFNQIVNIESDKLN